MSTFTLDNAGIMALGWTLIHSLWITLVLALLVRVLWYFVSPKQARLRYRVALSALSILFVASIYTFITYFQKYTPATFQLENSTPGITLSDLFFNMGANEMEAATGYNWEALIHTLEYNLPIIVLLWLLGTLFMGFRLVGSWWYLQQLGYKGVESAPQEWNHLFSELCTKMGIRRPVKLLVSRKVTEPITLRHLKPIVLFPIGLLTQLSMEQVEVILLHELAHIKRWDYLVNWLQSLLELLFFYHPAVWWLSAQVREAREHCCDDLVLQAGQQQKRMLYARTLTQLSAYSIHSKSKLAMSINGNKNSFTHRVKRLFGQVDNPFDWQKSLLSGLLVMLVLGVGMLSAPEIIANDLKYEEDKLATVEQDTIPKTINKGTATFDTKGVLDLNFIEKVKEEAGGYPVILVDGEIVDRSAFKQLKKENIDKVTVLKPGSANQLYGSAAKYGAVLITTIEKEEVLEKEAAKNVIVQLKGSMGDVNPLYVLDGERLDSDAELPADLEPDNIQTINVLKGEAAAKAYGTSGKNGVVEITTKDGLAKKPKGMSTKVEMGETFPEYRFWFGPEKNLKEVDPLVVIDGKALGLHSQVAKDINPDEMSYWIFAKPRKDLIEKYGPKAKNGALLMESKAAVEKSQGAVIEKLDVEGPDSEIELPTDKSHYENALVILDGEVKGVGKSIWQAIPSESIKQIDVIGPPRSVQLYGERAAEGAIAVYTKKQEKKEGNSYVRVRPAGNGDPLIVLDGKVLGKGKRLMEDLDPDKIQSINVLKGEPAKKVYGEKAKDGVVEIYTKGSGVENKNNVKKAEPTYIEMESADPARLDEHMVFVNGKKMGVWKDVKSSIDKSNIKKMDMYQKQFAPAKYKQYDRDIMLITTKKAGEEEKSQIVIGQKVEEGATTTFKVNGDAKEEGKKAPSIKIRSKTGDDDKRPLFVIDGKVLDKSSPSPDPTKELDPNDIEAISVLKDKSAVALYGEAGRDGVVIITTKNGQKKLNRAERRNKKKSSDKQLKERRDKSETPEIQETPDTPERLETVEHNAANALSASIENSLKAFPNPFNSEINISFVLPEDLSTEVSVFDANGRMVKMIQDKTNLPKGSYRMSWDASQVPNGNYTIIIKAGNTQVSKNILKQ